jgi:hypothetical protein
VKWAKAYDLSRLRLVVVGGDGANRIGKGAEVFANGIGQLDGFHLPPACGQAMGKRQVGSCMRRCLAGSWPRPTSYWRRRDR